MCDVYINIYKFYENNSMNTKRNRKKNRRKSCRRRIKWITKEQSRQITKKKLEQKKHKICRRNIRSRRNYEEKRIRRKKIKMIWKKITLIKKLENLSRSYRKYYQKKEIKNYHLARLAIVGSKKNLREEESSETFEKYEETNQKRAE